MIVNVYAVLAARPVKLYPEPDAVCVVVAGVEVMEKDVAPAPPDQFKVIALDVVVPCVIEVTA